MSSFDMALPVEVQFIIKSLEKDGFKANVVGGAVRDSLLRRTIGDYDITTDATPNEIKSVFKDFNTVDTGIQHGTVTVVIDHKPYEITTYRIDGDYKDNRHPDSVTFTRSLSEDLARRDFTVNAMAYNPAEGLTDLFGGVADATNRLIRSVGDARVRFDEDALRILRGLRFAATLGFDIEQSTAEAIREKAPLLAGVSSERIYQELKKLIAGKSASKIMRDFSDVIAPCLGGVSIENYPEDNKLENTEFIGRLALIFLLNSTAPVEAAERAFSFLRADNSTRYATKGAILAYGEVCFDTKRDILHSLAKHGSLAVDCALEIGLATDRFTEDDGDFYLDFTEQDPVYTVSGLKVDGNDLASLGYSGKEIGDKLNLLLYALIDGKVENEREKLIAYLQSKP